MKKMTLTQKNLANFAKETKEQLKSSNNTFLDGKYILVDSLESLTIITLEEAKKALDHDVQLCIASQKDVLEGSQKGKKILVPVENFDIISLAMRNAPEEYGYKICISPLYEETDFAPNDIKMALAMC